MRVKCDHEALREVARRQRRMDAVDRLREMGRRGDFDQAAEAHAAAKRAVKQAWASVPLDPRVVDLT